MNHKAYELARSQRESAAAALFGILAVAQAGLPEYARQLIADALAYYDRHTAELHAAIDAKESA